ncbi:group II intron reverse transcriptase/maturase [Paenibacillus wenxiniae]|uniref:Group II intron reverse transcriptase/maturase n=1 Tax=Paenibacillus wenxiniae TaxID=1636843 RepID=A0ABW4RIH7_9BACL
MLYEKELSEAELKEVKDQLYERSVNGERNFHNLMELILMRENLIHAIRKVKSNSGFKSAGVDNMKGQEFLQLEAEITFDRLREAIQDYSPEKVKRVYIPKSNGKLRPLGIPTITDRIIQTAVANIIEPIVEGIMYKHSYGFRPMRGISEAVAYLSTLTINNNRHFVLEGDIKGYFDHINHNILINKLYKYGIRDKRVLEVIKLMLKSGIEGEKEVNDIGTPQGGTISTLLSNVYLTDFDHWVSKQWLEFETKNKYQRQQHKVRAQKSTRMKMGYLIRYADDWIVMTDSEEAAVKWKHACTKFLREKLKIELSEEKTLITDLRKDKMNFLGITFFKRKGKNGNYTLRSEANRDRLREKEKVIYEALRKIRRTSNDVELFKAIYEYNSIVRGINNFYRITTLYNPVLSHLEWKMRAALNRTKRKRNGFFTKAANCPNIAPEYKESELNLRVLAFKIEGQNIGLTRPGHGKYVKPKIKAQWINPYSAKGRAKYEEVTGKPWTTVNRNPFISLGNISHLIARNADVGGIYNLEYQINRPMAFNRDKGKCRTCEIKLTGYGDTEIHHIDTSLDLTTINKLTNLVTLCKSCHVEEHRERWRAKQQEKEKAKARKSKTATSNKRTTNAQPKPRASSKPPREELYRDITTMSYVQIGLKYGVSGNAVKKWAISYDLHDLRLYKIKKKAR